MSVIYSEIDAHACAWLRNLIEEGHLHGHVIERDFREVQLAELGDARRVHWFAGIGGWELAARWAGWPDGLELWSGSCPCQPFSRAGRGAGVSDPRHLWPAWRPLIAERLPAVVVGEQVAGEPGLAWLDSVFDDLEALGYACGAADLAAASVGAPHARQRLYWAAVRVGVRVGDADGARLEVRRGERSDDGAQLAPAERAGAAGWVADDNGRGRQGSAPPRVRGAYARRHDPDGRREPDWSDAEWIQCTDGFARPAQPGAFPLAHGLPGRVAVVRPDGQTRVINRAGALHGIGNAIVPQVGAAFLREVLGWIAEAAGNGRQEGRRGA